MKNPLIKAILDNFNKSYEQGACDDLPKDQEQELLQKLASVKDILEDKQDAVMTTEEVSQFLNVSRQTVNTYVKEGYLHPKKQLGGVLQFKRKEVKALIKKMRQ